MTQIKILDVPLSDRKYAKTKKIAYAILGLICIFTSADRKSPSSIGSVDLIILEIIKKEKKKDLRFFDLRTNAGSEKYAPGECEIDEVIVQLKEELRELKIASSPNWVPRECTKEIKDLFIDYIGMEPKKLTLCIIYQHSKVLLGMKKRGYGVGRWNGFGGKVDGNDKSIEEAAKREVAEEAGLQIKSLEKMGVINFEFQDGSRSVEVHIFRSEYFVGQITESEEMKPEWFDIDNLPLKDMWPADTHWLPILLKGKKFKGKLIYDRPSISEYISNMIEKTLREVDEV